MIQLWFMILSKMRGLFDIRDTTIEYCETANGVKTCREYTGKILNGYFYDIASRPYYLTLDKYGSEADNLKKYNINTTYNKPVCSGGNWHLFNFEDAYLWRDNLGEIISGVDHIVLSWENDGSFTVATRFSQNKHYPGAANLKYKCVLKL